MLTLVILSVFAACGLVALVAAGGMAERAAVRASLRQLDDYEAAALPSREIELSEGFAPRVVAPVLGWLVGLGRRLTPRDYAANSAAKLAHAGIGSPDDVDRFLAVRVVTIALIPVAFALCYFVLPLEGRMPLGLFLFLTLLLVLGPDAVLNRKVEERRHQIQMRLPDVLDLLTISVEAGLGFEQALDRTVAAVPGPLSEEFARMIGETRAGSSRADALKSLEQRTGVPEVKSFVLALLQADAFGVSIGRILRQQAEEMRVRRRQLVQEIAQKAPVKMLFPMVFCIFPSLFVVVLAPAMFNIVDAL